MLFQYRKLRGRIIEKFGTISAFAEALGHHINIVSAKLNNKSQFSQSDIIRWSQLLDISLVDAGEYFFC